MSSEFLIEQISKQMIQIIYSELNISTMFIATCAAQLEKLARLVKFFHDASSYSRLFNS